MALLVDGIVPKRKIGDPASVHAAIDENKLLSGFLVEDEAIAPAAQQFVIQPRTSGRKRQNVNYTE
ncbi:hypothetical protein MP228_008822 [Amoeboaphelidium protococcarum]|nr:hypothetical protein MP228_008822 [Amoeboaphelidium protococcarum]